MFSASMCEWGTCRFDWGVAGALLQTDHLPLQRQTGHCSSTGARG